MSLNSSLGGECSVLGSLGLSGERDKALWTNVIAAVVPIVTVVVLGYAASRQREFSVRTMSFIVRHITTPALTFLSLATVDLSLGEIGMLFSSSIVLVLMGWAIVNLTCRCLKFRKSAFALSVIFPNTGNIAYPLLYLLFGYPGLARAIVFSSGNTIMLFSLGIFIAEGRARLSTLVRQPVLHAAALGYLVNVLNINIARLVMQPIEIAADAGPFLLLFTLGSVLGKIKLQHIRLAMQGCFARFGLGLGLSTLLVTLAGITGLSRVTIVTQFSMPPALMSFLIADAYGSEADIASALVMVGTVLAVITVPLTILLMTG